MEGETSITGEILAVLASSNGPLTRPEIYERCKLVTDQKRLSVTLSTLVKDGRLQHAGKRERENGVPLLCYERVMDGAARIAKRSTRKARSGSKSPRSAHNKRRSTHARRSARLPNVQRNTATSPAPDGFRCGIFNDGSLAIRAAEGEITLTEPETRAMFAYLDRVLPAIEERA